MGFQEMIRKGVIKATVMGGILVLVLTLILGLVLGFLFMQAAVMANLIPLILVLAVSGFIAGALTVYIIMKQTIKQFMPLIQSLMGPKKK